MLRNLYLDLWKTLALSVICVVGHIEGLPVKFIESKLELYSRIGDCYTTSNETVNHFEDFKAVKKSLQWIKESMGECIKKYGLILCSSSYTKEMYMEKYGDLIRSEIDMYRLYTTHGINNIRKDASIMWTLSPKRIAQSPLLYFTFNELPLSREFLLGDYVSKFESEPLTKFLRMLRSLSLVCKTWSHMLKLLEDVLEMNKGQKNYKQIAV